MVRFAVVAEPFAVIAGERHQHVLAVEAVQQYRQEVVGGGDLAAVGRSWNWVRQGSGGS